MPRIDEYGRKVFKPYRPPQPPGPPKGQGKPLGNRPEDYGPEPPKPTPAPWPGSLGPKIIDLAPKPGSAAPSTPSAPWPSGMMPPLTGITPAPGSGYIPTTRRTGPLGNNPEDFPASGTALPTRPTTVTPNTATIGQPQTVAPTSTASTASNARTALRTFTEGGTGSTGAASNQPTVVNTTSGGPTAQAVPTATSTESASPGTANTIADISQQNADILRSIQTGGAQAIQEASQYYQDMMSMLDQTKKDLIAQSEQDGKQLDPATLLTLDRLRQDADEGLKSVREVANRRGILDSGIALGMEQNVNKAYGQQEAGVLSDRLTRLRENLQTSLRQLSDQALGVQQQRASTLTNLRGKFFDTWVSASQRAADQALEQQRWETQRQDNLSAQAAQNAIRYSDLTGSVITPVSQADAALREAKRRYNAAKDAGDQAGMAAAAEMGRQARAMDSTLDPNNTMTYDQLNQAIGSGQSLWNQVNQGSQTAKYAQAALRSATGSSKQQAASSKLGVVQDLASLDVDPETSNLSVGEKRNLADYMLTQALVNGEITLDEYYAGQKERDSRWPLPKDTGDAIPAVRTK